MPSSHNIDKDGFITLSLKTSVLQQMLSKESVHMTDIHCDCAQSKQIIQQLLLQAVSTKFWVM